MISIEDKPFKFVLLWILAGCWVAVAVKLVVPLVWSRDLFWVGVMLSWLILPVAGLTQSLLLRGTVQRSWLWPLAAVAATVLGQLLLAALINLVLTSDSTLGRNWILMSATSAFATAIGVSCAQAVVLGIWRLGGWAWLGISFFSYSLASAANLTVIWPIMETKPVALFFSPLAAVLTLALAVVQVLLQWLIFGGITGWWLHRKLSARRSPLESMPVQR